MKKVTFIFANDDNDAWSTPLSLLIELKERGWDTEIVSIGSNRTGKYHDINLRNWVENKPNSDLVIFMDWGRFDSPYLDRKFVPNAAWIQESGDDPQNFERNFPKAHKFDITLTPDHDSYLEYMNRGIVAHWWTHFADTRIHHQMDNITTQYLAVTTRGFGGSPTLDAITTHSDGMVANRNGFEGASHTKFLQTGLMVLQCSRWGEITRRPFEAMACGKLVLTDRLNPSKKFEFLFTDRKHIVYYDSAADCMNLINYYTENALEREKIATAGMDMVLNHHTQAKRVDKLLLLVGMN